MRHKWLRFAASALLLGSINACGGGPFARPQTAAPAQPDHATQNLSPITPLLEMMSSLPQGDPARQAEQFQAAKDAADLTPTTSNRLRYALALATPGYSGSDPVAAQRQLSELLARPETLLPVERLLALVELKEVEQRLVLQAENKRVRDDAAHDDARDKLQAINRRLAAESDENVKLRKALDEARAKLEAVTHIERSINDRGTSGSHTP
jgi:predicted small lipoprotein YifL